ncbi:hypothetical protein IAU60_006122 [Kwoniella sp. DSM 27419]
MVDNLKKTMKKVKNVPRICHKLKIGLGRFWDWRGLVDSLYATWDVRSTILSWPRAKVLPIIEKICTHVSDGLPMYANQVNAVIDWDESRNQSWMSVRPGVDELLDGYREDYAGLDGMLTHVAQLIASRFPPEIGHSIAVIYLPQIGFHVAVDNDVHEIAGWKFQSEDKIFYKNKETVDLDEHYGDLVSLMKSREIDIIQELLGELPKYEQDICAATDIIAELDCLVSFASAARDYDLVRPVMTDDGTLKIRKGRHLLYERLVPGTYVPNDTLLRGGWDDEDHSMMIVTGANGSGKSAYGKQVALIVFMAQMGCFVPAEAAQIGLFFTRLQTKESASKTGSAFMIDLSQVSQALRGATQRSLIILDEFGKGTVSWDGAGLLAGTLEYLLKTSCPRTIVMTHFHELFTQNFLSEGLQVQFAHMKTTIAKDAEQLCYLYQLVPEPCLTSYAAECALQHGVPQEVVDRARFVTECVTTFQLSKLYDTNLSSKQIEQLDADQALAKRFLSWDIEGDSEDLIEVVRRMLAETEVKWDEEEGDSGESESGPEDSDCGGSYAVDDEQESVDGS